MPEAGLLTNARQNEAAPLLGDPVDFDHLVVGVIDRVMILHLNSLPSVPDHQIEASLASSIVRGRRSLSRACPLRLCGP